MKTKLLPLVAIISMAAFAAPAHAASISSEGSKAYAIDNNGNIVRDNYGACVRTIDWTKEAAIAACEAPAAKTTKSAAPAMAKAAPAASVAPVNNGIKNNGQRAYAIDSNGYIVRDGYGGCVRTIEWTKETAIAKCEGWEEPKAAKPAPVAMPAPKPAPVVKTVSEDVPAAFRGFFDVDKAKLKAPAIEELDVYSGYMKRNPEKKIKVIGHTDSTGTEMYNQVLSEKRANAVKTYLTGQGIDGMRINTLGMGESSPVASNATKEGRAQNRRVEIEVVK